MITENLIKVKIKSSAVRRDQEIRNNRLTVR
jgi:hypothetical protein